MEYGSRRLSCWCCCVVVAAVLLLSSPHTLVAAAGAAPRRLLQISEAQQFVVPQTPPPGDLRPASAQVEQRPGGEGDAVGGPEAQHYDYGANACAAGKECGRYKQMMWRDSTQVGCASVPCASGETLMACHYEPQGNIMGQKPF
uniref:SCP domain-containing protein n=1 Tax=Oryza brachyantha TaxID=4533 RepID=J3LHT5_ORYBR